MIGTWIHLNLKTIEILKDQTQNKYMFKVNSRNIERKCDLFKDNNIDNRVIASFCSGVVKVP